MRCGVHDCNEVWSVWLEWSVECMTRMKCGVYDCNEVWSVRLQWRVECMTEMKCGVCDCSEVWSVWLQWSVECMTEMKCGVYDCNEMWNTWLKWSVEALLEWSVEYMSAMKCGVHGWNEEWGICLQWSEECMTAMKRGAQNKVWNVWLQWSVGLWLQWSVWCVWLYTFRSPSVDAITHYHVMILIIRIQIDVGLMYYTSASCDIDYTRSDRRSFSILHISLLFIYCTCSYRCRFDASHIIVLYYLLRRKYDFLSLQFFLRQIYSV